MTAGRAHREVHHIEISLNSIQQLFNSMDPAPFHERDLDQDAEEFLVGWAQEHPIEAPLKLILHLKEWPEGTPPPAWVEGAIHHYFADRARLNDQEFSRLMKVGRMSLLIGTLFLTACLVLAQVAAPLMSGLLQHVVREGLLILGWVAMWRPLQIYLYDWWPVRRRGRVLRKMSRMPVSVRIGQGKAGAHAGPARSGAP